MKFEKYPTKGHGRLPCWLSNKESACEAGDAALSGFKPGVGKIPGEGNGSPLQYSGLEIPMDGGAWRATIHGAAKSRTRLKRLSAHTSH